MVGFIFILTVNCTAQTMHATVLIWCCTWIRGAPCWSYIRRLGRVGEVRWSRRRSWSVSFLSWLALAVCRMWAGACIILHLIGRTIQGMNSQNDDNKRYLQTSYLSSLRVCVYLCCRYRSRLDYWSNLCQPFVFAVPFRLQIDKPTVGA